MRQKKNRNSETNTKSQSFQRFLDKEDYSHSSSFRDHSKERNFWSSPLLFLYDWVRWPWTKKFQMGKQRLLAGLVLGLGFVCPEAWASPDSGGGLASSRSEQKILERWLDIYKTELTLMIHHPVKFRLVAESGQSLYLQSLFCVETLAAEKGSEHLKKVTAPLLTKTRNIENYMAAQDLLLKKALKSLRQQTSATVCQKPPLMGGAVAPSETAQLS